MPWTAAPLSRSPRSTASIASCLRLSWLPPSPPLHATTSKLSEGDGPLRWLPRTSEAKVRSMKHGIHLEHDELIVDGVRVSFERTLRIPEHGTHPLPPSLGQFPLRRMADYPDTAPAAWLERGGVMLPVYQREALWLSVSAEVPSALRVGVGKVCAVSGSPWIDALSQEPQNYLALPLQPWLDGINSGDGSVRQFVAVQHGLGATVEGQVTGQETHGGMQLAAHTLTPAAQTRWAEEQKRRPATHYMACASAPMSADMGIGAGGRMRQEIYEDQRPVTDYNHDGSRVFVHLCSAAQWRSITGEDPPTTPVSARAYNDAGLPWFDYYDADAQDLAPSQVLADLRPVGGWLGEDPELQGLQQPAVVVPVGPAGTGTPVADGSW